MTNHKKAYRRPVLTEWGSVTELTANGLKGGSGDGVTKFSVTPPGQIMRMGRG